jgi:HprK-related kinase A
LIADQPSLSFRTGPFGVRLTTDYRPLIGTVRAFYPGCQLDPADTVHAYHVRVERLRNPRRWWRRQAQFYIDGERPFDPYPLDHAFPFLEWGINWCIATRAHQYLMLHSGAVEVAGRGMLLPATPGSGKSTLSAGLALRGFRLLSDEFGLYDPRRQHLVPLPRAVPLKNRSIQVIRDFAPDAYIGPTYPKTRKGDVAHLRPPGDSISRQHEPAKPRWVVFPRFQSGAQLKLTALPKSVAFNRLAQNSFNYALLHLDGFQALGELIKRCDCYSLRFGDLEQAVAQLSRLATAED